LNLSPIPEFIFTAKANGSTVQLPCIEHTLAKVCSLSSSEEDCLQTERPLAWADNLFKWLVVWLGQMTSFTVGNFFLTLFHRNEDRDIPLIFFFSPEHLLRPNWVNFSL